MQTLLQDLRYSVRLLRKSPGFTAAAAIALALGIGANTAIFSVANSILFRPLPFRNAGRLAVVWENSPGQGWARIGVSGPNFLDFRRQNRTLEDMVLFEAGSGTVTGFGEPQQIPGMRVTNNFLSALGFRPALGRDFLPSEGWNQRVAIISDNMWARWFGRDPGAVGRRVKADGLMYTVVGILPRDFWFPVATELLVPWVDQDLLNRNRMDHGFGVFAHLKPGVTLAQATADLGAIERRIGEQFAGMRGWGVTLVPVRDAITEKVRTGLILLLGTVAMVLLIACANLANLLLARAAVRERETAVRMALGAGRWRLVRQFLTESTGLSLLGGALGLLLAVWGVGLLEQVAPHTFRLAEGSGEIVRPAIAIDGRVLLFTLLVSLATGLVFGIAPAFAASRADMNATLKEGGRGASRTSRRLRGALAISEVAVALVLLIGSALTLKSFWRLQQVDPGFRPVHVLAMEMELPTDSRYRTAVEQREFFRRVLENVRAVPGVRSAGISNVLPLDASEDEKTEFVIEGRAPLPSGQQLPADHRAVSPDYFRTMGIPLLRGRAFSDGDSVDRPLVAVISASLARRYWPDGSNPLGHRLIFGRSGAREIVGIVGDVNAAGLDRQPAPTIYTCYLQNPEFRMTLVARTAAEPAGMIGALKRAIYAVDREQPIFKIRTMDELLSDSESSSRFTLVVLGIFAAVALALAAAGIYGVISYTVAQRTREIGIRMALGARNGDVLRLVMRQGLRLALAGTLAGLAGAFVLGRLIASLLYGVSPRDPAIFAASAAFLVAVALLATYLPARRAMKLDPTRSLRYE